MGSGDDTNIHTRLHHFQKDPILQPYAPETPEYIRVLGITVVLYTSSVYTLLHTRLSFKWSRALPFDRGCQSQLCAFYRRLYALSSSLA